MRRFSFIVAFVALMFSPVLAQDISVSLDNVQGLVPGTDNQLIAGADIVFGMRFTNNGDLTYTGFTNGFRVYSDDGATWSGFQADTTGGIGTYQSSVFTNLWSITGADADTVGCNGFTIPFPGQPPGFTPGMDAVFFNLSFATNTESHGKTICLDSTWTQPNNAWQWSEGGNPYYPSWDGPHCFTVIDTAAAQTALVVLPDSLTFDATEGDGLLTAQPIVVSEQGGGAIDYSAVAGDAWVVLTDPTGTTPGTVDVNVNATGVTEGTYTSTVTVTSTGATNTEEVVVTLNVAAAPKILVATPDTLFFTATEGDGLLASQDIAVSEQGGEAIAYTSTAADAWVELTNPNGTTPGTVTVAANATGVTEGVYYSSVTVASIEADNDVDVVIAMTVAAAPGELVLDTDTLFFEGTEGDGILPTQQVAVTEASGRNIDYSAGPDVGWIGLIVETDLTPGAVTVMLSTESVAGPGVYTGTVTVSSPDAENDPQFVVVFTVNEQPSALAVNPTELNAFGQEGVAETIRLGIAVSEIHDRNIDFSAVATQSWLTFETASGTTPDSVIVLIATDGLTEGVYNDNISITSPDADTIVVPVTLTMSAADARYLMTSDTTFLFTVNEGDITFPSDAFLVMEEEGDSIPYMVSSTVSWLTVDPDAGITPGEVDFDLVGPFVATDTPYVGSILIASDSAANSPLEVVVTVDVTPCPQLVLPVVTDTVTVVVGEVNVPWAITVLSSADEITWNVADGGGFTFDALTGLTPDSIGFTFNETFSETGQYERCFTISSPATDETNCFSEVDYCLLIDVQDAPCSEMVLTDTLFVFDAVEGDLVTVPERDFLFVLPALGDTVDFTYVVEAEAGVDYVTFTNLATAVSGVSVEGEPDDSIEIVVNPSGLPVGTNTINCTVTGSENVCAPGVEMFTIEVDIEELIVPSDDTVRVVTQPAVPGMQMMLPVYFSNSCPTQTVFASFDFDGEALNLDSVSFVGTRAEGLEGNEVTYFNATPLGQVNLTADVGTGEMIPVGSGPMANLYFSVRCETESGFYPLNLSSMFIPLSMTRDCGDGLTVETPEFVSGGIVIDTSSNYVCGYVVDEEGNSIPGATVELYGDFPVGPAIDQTTSSMIGSFAFADFTTIPFDLYAYADGYYPNKVEDLNFGDKGVMIVLSPLPELTPTSQWVDYYCDDNTYAGEPLPAGSVVEAWFNGLLVGQDVVVEAGSYGFMPVYRASDDFGDDGAMTDSTIAFTINGMPAIADGDVIYPADYDQVQVCLSAGDQEVHSCDLLEGWNLISWRVDTESDDLMDVLGPYMNNIEVVLGFEQGGLTYDPDLVEFSTLFEVDHLSGYWVKVKEGMGFTLEVTGAPVAVNTPIPVTTGWNLVSYLPEATFAPVDALVSLDGILLYAYGWDAGIKTYAPAQPDFSTLEDMASCNGYWVKVSANGTLVYPEDILIPAASTRPDAPVASAATSYKSTQWVNLYSRDLRVDGHAVSEGDVITAHTASGDMVGEFKMSASGTFGFMPVYGAASASEAGVARGEDFYLAVNGSRTNETFTWTGNGDRIEVLSLTTGNGIGNLPQEYSLAQNYPNPFNPTTTISFNLPVSGMVKLEVFNILGKLVATPFDGRAEAGTVEVVWDGSNTNGSQVSSGVYFYRLTADTYTNTKKMMLLK